MRKWKKKSVQKTYTHQNEKKSRKPFYYSPNFASHSLPPWRGDKIASPVWLVRQQFLTEMGCMINVSTSTEPTGATDLWHFISPSFPRWASLKAFFGMLFPPLCPLSCEELVFHWALLQPNTTDHGAPFSCPVLSSRWLSRNKRPSYGQTRRFCGSFWAPIFLNATSAHHHQTWRTVSVSMFGREIAIHLPFSVVAAAAAAIWFGHFFGREVWKGFLGPFPPSIAFHFPFPMKEYGAHFIATHENGRDSSHPRLTSGEQTIAHITNHCT